MSAVILWDPQQDRLCLCHTSRMDRHSQPYIIKFDEEGKELTKIEYAYTKLAQQAGIETAEVSLIKSGEETHFASRRFDRDIERGTKLHQATLAGVTHEDFMGRFFSYEKYLRIAQALTTSVEAGKEAYRRMVFNVIGKNCDDHIKNLSFLMDHKGTWSLSPAYDLIHSDGPATFGEHRMTINGKVRDITLEDLLQCGISSGLEPKFMKYTIEEISDLFTEVSQPLQDVDVSTKTIQTISKSVVPLSVNGFDAVMKRVKSSGKKRR